MNGNNDTERTGSMVVTTIGDTSTDNVRDNVSAGGGDSTPQPPKLLNLGTPEAAAPHPIYLREKDESQPSSPSVVPGLSSVAPETAVTMVPAVGAQTIKTMHAAGASVLVIEAGRSLVFDKEEMVSLADQYGITVMASENES